MEAGLARRGILATRNVPDIPGRMIGTEMQTVRGISHCLNSFAIVAALMLAPVAAWAQAKPGYVLAVSAERPDATYTSGETVSFTISLSLGGRPVDGATVGWDISKDGAPPSTKGTLRLTNGRATVTGKLGEPGFLQCRVSFTTPEQVAL